MSIITGKSLVAALAALAVAAGVQAQEKVLYSENFEEAIPGQTPKKWTKVWGSPGSDIFAVTNEKSAGGDNALLLTRGDNQGQWGFGVAFPHVDRGTVEISFNLLLEGLMDRDIILSDYTGILHSHKRGGSKEIYFIVNDTNAPKSIKAEFPFAKALECWNPQTGDVQDIQPETTLTFGPYEGLIIRKIK